MLPASVSADVGLGGCHRGLGGTDRRRGQLDLRLGLGYRCLLLAKLVFQLGEEQVGKQLIGLHAVADVHVELLRRSGQLGEQRRLLECLDLARLDALPAERLPRGRAAATRTAAAAAGRFGLRRDGQPARAAGRTQSKAAWPIQVLSTEYRRLPQMPIRAAARSR